MNVMGHDFSRMMTGRGMVVSFYVDDPETVEIFFQENKEPELEVDIHKKQKKRSLDANAYAWVLLDKLAAKLKTTSVEIYKEMVQRVGPFNWAMVPDDEADSVIITWATHGIGWVAVRAGHRPQGTVLKLYKGSSVYSVEEMQRLIEEIQSECKQQGIETMTPNELRELLERWN